MSATSSCSSLYASPCPLSPTHLLVNPETLTPEEVAEKLFFFLKNKKTEGKYPSREQLRQLELRFRTLRPILSDPTAYELRGGISMAMDYRSIAGAVRLKFNELKEQGILITRSAFNEKYTPGSFRTLGKITHEGQKTGKLERLWGAECLRKRLDPEGPYRVPRFIIVIEDSVKRLPVSLNVGRLSHDLSIHSIETEYGEVLVERIDGIPISGLHHKDALDPLGYDDYRDPGNILQKDGKFYIVDTEWKSLKGIPDNPKQYRQLQTYLKDRFQAYFPRDLQTIMVSLFFSRRCLTSVGEGSKRVCPLSISEPKNTPLQKKIRFD